MKGASAGSKRSSKYTIHHLTMSPFKVNSSPFSIVKSVGGLVLVPPVSLQGLPYLFPDPKFGYHDCSLCHMFSLPVPISLRSPPNQLSSIRLLLHLDSIPYFQCLPPGSGSAAVTYTGDLTAPNSFATNGSGKHGPLGINVPSIPPGSGQSSLGGSR